MSLAKSDNLRVRARTSKRPTQTRSGRTQGPPTQSSGFLGRARVAQKKCWYVVAKSDHRLVVPVLPAPTSRLSTLVAAVVAGLVGVCRSLRRLTRAATASAFATVSARLLGLRRLFVGLDGLGGWLLFPGFLFCRLACRRGAFGLVSSSAARTPPAGAPTVGTLATLGVEVDRITEPLDRLVDQLLDAREILLVVDRDNGQRRSAPPGAPVRPMRCT